MACRITRECISCGICLGRCPNNAVYVDGEDKFAIDPRRCTECIDQPQRRCDFICSVGAIQPDPLYKETAEERWAKHRAIHAFSIDDLLNF